MNREKRRFAFLGSLFRSGGRGGGAAEAEWKRVRKSVYEAIRQRHFDQIEPRTRELEKLVEALPQDVPERYERMNEVGELFQELAGSNTTAESLFRRAGEESALHLGEDHGCCILSRNNLGLLLLQQRRFEEAEGLFSVLLPLVESRFGAESTETASCLENLAGALRGLEKSEEARQARARALQIRKTAKESG